MPAPAHLHLILNHVPVLGVVFGITLLVAALVRRNQVLGQAALVTFVVCAVTAAIVFFTGEPAEKIVEHLPGVASAAIERHEEAAKVALAAMVLLGTMSLAGLLLFRTRPSIRGFDVGILILALGCFATIAWTAALGGQIRHTEIAPGAVTAPAYAGDRD